MTRPSGPAGDHATRRSEGDRGPRRGTDAGRGPRRDDRSAPGLPEHDRGRRPGARSDEHPNAPRQRGESHDTAGRPANAGGEPRRADRDGNAGGGRPRPGGRRRGGQRATQAAPGQQQNPAGPRKGGARKGAGRTSSAPAAQSSHAGADVVQWTPPPSGMPSFAELGLPERLVKALADEGFTAPFPVQAATLPDTLAGRDLLGRGQTGSGKTLAFGLALLARLTGERARPTAPRGLVLVPTRELATQVVDVLTPLAAAVDLRVTAVVGGMSMNRQISELRRGIDLLVATPGRLTDHIQQGTCDLSEVTVAALDEADRMADMGFLPQVRAILDRTPSDGQRLLFSATLDGEVDTLVRRHLTDPVTRSVAPPTASVDTMEHHVLVVPRDDRSRVIAEIAAREGRTILFVRTKHGADRMVRVLRRQGVAAGPLHGGRSQNQRNRALDEFRTGEVPVLVATDVAARGIHIDDVGLVVHVDPPADPKAYLHRAGRTARAGETGVVVTLSTPEQKAEVDTLTRQAGVRPEVATVGPGHPDLVRVTGSREPSGEPIATPKRPQPKPKQGRRRR
ncbi:DEAD/DEAH box helicase [Pseudonocardia ammonioxydans]|uniref:DEAD/DEAH box helicase n=1 Tax=Pseudonocardia ammonioxydans TaxID=260086 RepID=UPI001FE47790|nr:DEAD/DEAH box helicase [Pseudonocardia ammonioxydans]